MISEKTYSTNPNDYIKPLEPQKEAMKYIGRGYKIFYGGQRGSGKSNCIQTTCILTAHKYPGITCVIFRKTYGELNDEMIQKMLELYPAEIFQYRYLDKNKVFKFTNGSRIMFRAIVDAKAAQKTQGVEYQLICIDEAPNFEVDVIQKICGSLRNAHIANFIPTLLMTGNPGGISNRWFKTHFVKPDYSLWTENELRDKEKYIFVHGKAEDNIYARDEYIPWLKTLPERQQKLWLQDDWDDFEGQFFETWDKQKHVIPTFTPPAHWQKIGGLDLGWSKEHPTVLLLGAQDPATDIVYIYKEYYQWGAVQQYIDDIYDIVDDEKINIIYADPSMWTTRKLNYTDESPGKMFTNAGIFVMPADNRRVNGWRIVKEWMEKPLLQIMDCCTLLIETMPTMKYNDTAGNKEDLNSKLQDDACDALRYMLVNGFNLPTPMMDDKETEAIKRFYMNRKKRIYGGSCYA